MADYFEGDWIVLPEPAYVLCGDGSRDSLQDPEQGSRGLLWGRGSPSLADLWDEPWIVVKISSYYEIRQGDRTAVGFRDHEIVMDGSRREVLDALVSLGAPAESLSTELQVVDRGAVAKTAHWGTSIAGDFGIAKSGDVGHSQAGSNGIAVSGDRGFASAGEDGIAVVDGDDAYSIATAGNGGIAVGLGKSSMQEIATGDYGIAIRLGVGGRCKAGDLGIVVGDDVKSGANSTVIGRMVSGGAGSLLISRHFVFESGASEFATGVVGQNGVEPNVTYIARNGVLDRVSDA